MAHRALTAVLLGGILAVSAMGAAAAAGSQACVTRSENNQTFVLPNQMTRSLAYSGPDAQLFIGGLGLLMGSLPDTINAAVSVSAYLPTAGTASSATVRFYDAKGCDVGVATQVAPSLLDFIISTIGQRV